MSSAPLERPNWLRVRYRATPALESVQQIVRDQQLHTVCAAAACPNLGECWSRGTATFMIGGNQCTRACGFCDVKTGRPGALDPGEPERIAAGVESLGLGFAVITAVARDDLVDGGAAHMAATVEAIHQRCPATGVEVLVPDYKGRQADLETVLQAGPEVLNHNLETVERLQRRIRPAARYQRSLELLRRSRSLEPGIPSKTGIMLGLGEQDEEIAQCLRDIAAVGVRLLTLGQYLSPSRQHLPVERYVAPAEFDAWAEYARSLGILQVAAGPLVRSSYHAEALAGRDAR